MEGEKPHGETPRRWRVLTGSVSGETSRPIAPRRKEIYPKQAQYCHRLPPLTKPERRKAREC